MPKLNLKHRWIKARPGSVLILVIALLVLLALIGTAYLSSTQGERYSSVQNSINTEADLLIQGLQTAVNSQIAGGLYAGSSYRPPQQEQPSYSSSGASKVSLTGYFNYDSATVDPNLPVNVLPPDLFLGDRIPVPASANSAIMLGTVPVWNSISWPLFTDPSGNYTFDSPIDPSLTTFLAVNKGKIVAEPTYTTVNSTNYPAMIYFVPSAAPNLTLLQTSPASTVTVSSPGQFLTPTGLSNTAYAYLSASAAGDGIADAGLFKLPVGPIDGITYYGAIRVLDGNSAINVSSAYTQGPDTVNGTTNSAINYGFFRSNIGLKELLNTNNQVLGIRRLNTYRFPATFSPNPVPDSNYFNPPTNFTWYSLGDALDNELTRRAGNPAQQYNWLGQSATAALAYKYSLVNANTTPSAVESSLAGELLNSPSTPWSPAQVGGTGPIISNSWYYDNFYYLNNYTLTSVASRLRTVLVGNNAVSNAVAPRYGNASSTPTAWNDSAGTTYQFGDWVVDGPAGHQRSFVCIQPHTPTTANEPEPQPYTYPGGAGANTSFNPGALGYWAGAQGTAPININAPLPGVPWSTVPVKTSVNTATFEQLWLAFAQVMTDSIGVDTIPTGDVPLPVGTPTAQWQPPMQPVAVTLPTKEQQMGQFRSVIRDSHADGLGKTVLSSSQMLKLRAAIAAVNTMDLRDSDDNVTSAHIVLTDGTTTTTHWYDVEVYGTEKQPYISEVVIQTDGKPYPTGSNNYIAVELCNPYMKPITLTGWQIGSMNRTAFPTMSLAPGLLIPTVTIPAATANGVPGLLILEDGTRPTDVNTTIMQNQTSYPAPEATAGAIPTVLVGLYDAAINASNQANEIFLMRPRLITGPSSSSGTTNDTYTEVAATNLADFVPVDQLDLTNLAIPAAAAAPPPPMRFLYRRANDGTTAVGKAFHCVYPGFYDPTNPSTMGRYFTASGGASAIIEDTTATQACFLAGPTGATGVTALPGQGSTYTTLPIELNNVNMGGPHPIASASNSFPYGQFARNADMLQIPFIGAYRIRPYLASNSPPNPEAVTELNSVTIDSALANDNTASTYALPIADQPGAITTASSTTTAFYEQIGRFCPVGDVNSPTNDPSVLLDFGPGYTPGDLTNPNNNKVYWHYHWAKKLFDYLTVQAPSDDYYPNVNPVQAAGTITPVPVANTNSAYANTMVAGHAEDTTGVEGLININTAPAAVLAQLPLTGTATVPSIATNMTIANAIVSYRNQHGPFQSIMDLYRVPAFMNQNEALITTAAGPAQGVFSPGGIGTGAATPTGTVRFDFQERFLLLNNISNLITTRSDTFTCYVLLQGWRNVGTGNPTLVVQRRLAFLVDRNGVTPSNNQPASLKFPSD